MTNQATNNKSFILHLDSLIILEKLSDDQAGKIFKAIYQYQKTGKITQLDFALDLAFTPFLNQFLRDDEKYKITCERRREAGSKGGKQKVANASKSKQKIANLADSDSKNKNDSDSKNDNKNIILISESEIDELTNGLKFVLEAKLNKKLNTNSWKKEIKLLVEKDLLQRQDAVADVKRAIQEVSNRFGEQYFPVIQSASSLREKFSKIEAAIARSQPQQSSAAKDYINLMKKYDNE